MPAPVPETERPAVIPAGSLLLHIGPPKTGSTAIQQAMHESRAALAEHGVLYPGTRRRARSASFAVLGVGSAIGRPAPRMESWEALVDEVRTTDLPRACVSHENFSRADDAAADRILDGFGRDRTHVVYVARRLDKVLPSHWQERVKSWETASYDEFLHRLLDEPVSSWRKVWQPHDVAGVVARWTARVGPERVTVVVSEEHDRGLVPRTFEALLGLPDGLLAPRGSGSNTSLSWTETEVVRSLNQLARDEQWTPREYWRIVQEGVVEGLRRRQDERDPRIGGLPGWALERVAERADRQINAIRSAGVRVVGDPEGLRIDASARADGIPAPVESVPLELLAASVQGALEGARAMHRREVSDLTEANRADGDRLSGRHLLRLLARRVARIGVRRR
jgi:hypothetical protein